MIYDILICQDGSDQRLKERYSTLKGDSLYTRETYEYTKRTITPVMASLAELIRSSPKYKDNYEWFVELAKNFHWIQSKMTESTDKVSCSSWYFSLIKRTVGTENISFFNVDLFINRKTY